MNISKILVAALLLTSTWSTLTFAQDYNPNPAAARSQVPDGYKWDLTDLYETPEAWETEFTAVKADIPKLADCNGKLGDSAQNLSTCLDAVYALDKRISRLYVYAGRAFDQDQGVDETKVRKGKIDFILPEFMNAVSFLEPEILQIDDAKIQAFMAEHEPLRTYGYYLKNIQRMKPYTLTAPEERIMALAGGVTDAPYYIHENLLNVDISFPEITDEKGNKAPLTVTGFTRMRGSQDPAVRKAAADIFFGTLKNYENTFANMLDGIVKAHILQKDARGYDTCLEAALTPDNISPDAYKMLVSTINDNLPRTLHRYVALRKKLLKIDGKVTFDNLYNPLLTDVPELTYTYDEGRALILKALKPLGPDYLAFVDEGMDPANGWVDVFPNADKDTGAYMSGGAYDVHPYVLLNTDNTLDSMFTTAHEYGHAMHSVYSGNHQPYHYADYSTFIAEIASTSNEALLLDYMLENNKDINVKLMLLNQRLENIRLTIFRQTLFAEFELLIHERGEEGLPLTADFLNETYKGLIQKYYGPEFEVGEYDVVEWAFIPHFFYNFYVFTYATGLTAGLSIAEQIEDQGKVAAERYKANLLSAGSSAPPLDILRAAGVDLEKPDPIVDMLDLFEETLVEFEELYDKAQKKKK